MVKYSILFICCAFLFSNCAKNKQKTDSTLAIENTRNIDLQGHLYLDILTTIHYSKSLNQAVLDTSDSSYFLPNIDTTYTDSETNYFDSIIIDYDSVGNFTTIFRNNENNIAVYFRNDSITTQINHYQHNQDTIQNPSSITQIIENNSWTTKLEIHTNHSLKAFSGEWNSNFNIDTFYSSQFENTTLYYNGLSYSEKDSCLYSNITFKPNCNNIHNGTIDLLETEINLDKTIQFNSSNCSADFRMKIGNQSHPVYYGN